MIYVPEGEFLIGSDSSDANAEHIEKPQRLIYLNSYWIDQTEVTNTMFEKFVNETGYVTTAEKAGSVSYIWNPNTSKWIESQDLSWYHPTGPASRIQDRMEDPVIHVSWWDAAAYCSWAGRRLPTEVEWEKAAKGPDGLIYPWGNQFPSKNLANFNYLNNGTIPVTSLPDGKRPYGAYQMAGNVWEWVNDY